MSLEAHNKTCRDWARNNPERRKEIKRKSYAKNSAATLTACQAYTRTFKGFLVRTYRNMQNRVEGKTKPHLYAGLPLLPRAQFYAWAEASNEYRALFTAWEASGQEMRLAPSVDRVDPAKGYELPNMRWVTHGENSARVLR